MSTVKTNLHSLPSRLREPNKGSCRHESKMMCQVTFTKRVITTRREYGERNLFLVGVMLGVNHDHDTVRCDGLRSLSTLVYRPYMFILCFYVYISQYVVCRHPCRRDERPNPSPSKVSTIVNLTRNSILILEWSISSPQTCNILFLCVRLFHMVGFT